METPQKTLYFRKQNFFIFQKTELSELEKLKNSLLKSFLYFRRNFQSLKTKIYHTFTKKVTNNFCKNTFGSFL